MWVKKRVPKMVFDGLTRAGFWEDDNRFVIPELHFYSDYEARNPHMIIEVETELKSDNLKKQ